MRKDLTDITVVLDRSGSMSSCRAEAEGGLNTFIDEQKKQPGHALFTLVQFDTEYEFLHRGDDLQSVGKQTLVPRGNTALLDAVGRAIHETGMRLRDMNEADRPALVLFVIITDGQENSSSEFSRAKIQEMIRHQHDVYKWKFQFLGADQDAFAEAGAMGISPDCAADYNKASADRMFLGMARKVSRMRRQSNAGETVMSGFTESERREIKNED